MAIEKLILRPTRNEVGSNIGLFTYFPSETPHENLYTLISEEVADGDATYVIAFANALQALSFRPYVTVPENYKNKSPSGMTLYAVARNASDTDLIFNVLFYSNPDNVLYEEPVSSSTYETISVVVTSEDLGGVWENLCNPDADAHFLFHATSADGSKGSSAENLYVTQIYLEVDFEVEDPPTGVFIKRNGAFVQADRSYHKVNGAWTEITDEECIAIIQAASQT